MNGTVIIQVVNGRPRGKSHTVDCYVPKRFELKNGSYQSMDASKVPSRIERCSICGGGR